MEAVPERHMTVRRQIGEREAVMAIEPQLLSEGLRAVPFDEDLAEVAQEEVKISGRWKSARLGSGQVATRRSRTAGVDAEPFTPAAGLLLGQWG